MLLRDCNEAARRAERHESRELACKHSASGEIVAVIYRRGSEAEASRREREQLRRGVLHHVLRHPGRARQTASGEAVQLNTGDPGAGAA